MDLVHVLDDAVIDQIAAGEVVERPASVVKELVENALDAGAAAITVDVEGGGRRLIRVVDDGCGMSPSDARRALGRHATSKLRVSDDLWTLTTMGFRGEALPSIASVSRLTLTTRRRDDLAAVRLVSDCGDVQQPAEAGAPAGTCVEVRDLLANVPARLKFLKGDTTEASHVTEVVTRLAMTHPQVHFRLRMGGRTALDVPPSDAAERVREVVGGRALHEVHGEDGGVRVTAYLGAPDLAQATARGVQIYVGRRFVRDRNLLHAVTMGYGELVPRGRYPVAIVMIDVPGGLVDVNVHPQKLEVRFSDAPSIATAVRHLVRRGLASAPWNGEVASMAAVQVHAVASMGPPRMGMASDLAARYAETTTRALFPIGGMSRPAVQGTFGLRAPEAIPAPMRAAEGSAPGPSAWASTVRARISERAQEAAEEARAVVVPAQAFFSRLRYLGQLDRTYLVCEADGELVLIDQHLAHERVEIQRLRDRSSGDVSVQRLLFPQTVELSNPGALDGAADVLAAVGFEVEPFGGNTVAIKAIPAGLRADATVVLRDLLADLDGLDDRLDHVVATVACHSVVRAGDPLSPREAESLLAQMDGVDFQKAGLHHARPVLLRMSITEIARRFGR